MVAKAVFVLRWRSMVLPEVIRKRSSAYPTRVQSEGRGQLNTSLKLMFHRKGLRTEPWGHPLSRVLEKELDLIVIWECLSERKFLMVL